MDTHPEKELDVRTRKPVHPGSLTSTKGKLMEMVMKTQFSRHKSDTLGKSKILM